MSIIYITLSGYALHIITDHALHNFISTFNVSLATVLCLFFPIRVVWAFFRQDLPPVKGTSETQHAIAVFAHSLIYMSIFMVLATGYLMIPNGYSFFWLFTIPTHFHAGEATDFFFMTHKISCMILAGLVVMHVAAVVQHYVMHHINILKRML